MFLCSVIEKMGKGKVRGLLWYKERPNFSGIRSFWLLIKLSDFVWLDFFKTLSIAEGRYNKEKWVDYTVGDTQTPDGE